MRQWCRSFLAAIPGLQYNVFIYIVSFFREILALSEYNKSTPERLGFLVTMMLTGCVDTSKPATFGDFANSPFPVSANIQKDSRYSFMVPVVTYFLTAPSF